jgi:rod shape determining protein RodA
VIVILGWLNIFAAVYDESLNQNIFDLSLNSGKQLIWIASSVVLIALIMSLDYKFYDTFGFVLFGGIMLLLVFVLLFGREVAGSKSWFEIGSFRLQPSEFAKFATALAVAKFASMPGKRIEKLRTQLVLGGIIAIPPVLIILQGDTGTALVYSAFVLVLFREGMSPVLLILGTAVAAIFILTLLVANVFLYVGIVGFTTIMVLVYRKNLKRIAIVIFSALLLSGSILGVNFFISDVLKPHQQNRVKALINPEADPLGYGWNVTQSKIAIGSGGFYGKGFLQGTQTKFDFVPEQSTDFIFCTIGEEHGWIGSLILISLFLTLLLRVVYIAERQKWTFARVYGYSVACILFFNFAVNIGLTIGLFPVIGIPLPFFSYGGSSLWAFTILLFILIKLDSHRMQVLVR